MTKMNRYLIVVEPTHTGYSAYSPDLLGCISTGRTREEVERNIREALALHTAGMLEDGQSLPEPHSYSTYVEISA
jgi:predicted RNase H-like HicB family nuclease